MCVSINFYFPFRSWLNACHPPSPLLFSVPLVSIRLTRLWTILCPVSIVLAQPALRAAKKVMFTTRTQSTFLALPLELLVQRLALLVLVHSASRAARPAAVVLPENSRGRGRISVHPAEPLGRCVFCTLAVPNSPHFHVGNTNIL